MRILPIISGLLLALRLGKDYIQISDYEKKERLLSQRIDKKPATYVNAKGKQIFTSTGEECYYWYGKLIDLKSHEVLFDYNAESEKEKEIMIKQIVKKYEFDYYTEDGIIYSEVSTGKKYKCNFITQRPPNKNEIHWKINVVDLYDTDTGKYVKTLKKNEFKCFNLCQASITLERRN